MRIIFEDEQEKKRFIESIQICPSALRLHDNSKCNNCKECWEKALGYDDKLNSSQDNFWKTLSSLKINEVKR